MIIYYARDRYLITKIIINESFNEVIKKEKKEKKNEKRITFNTHTYA